MTEMRGSRAARLPTDRVAAAVPGGRDELVRRERHLLKVGTLRLADAVERYQEVFRFPALTVLDFPLRLVPYLPPPRFSHVPTARSLTTASAR